MMKYKAIKKKIGQTPLQALTVFSRTKIDRYFPAKKSWGKMLQ